jgi:hypothetical protein
MKPVWCVQHEDGRPCPVFAVRGPFAVSFVGSTGESWMAQDLRTLGVSC